MRNHPMLLHSARIRTPKWGQRAVRTMLGLASFATIGGYAYADSGQWKTAINGTWTNSARWTGASFPNDPNDSATINATGSAYTVTLNSDISVNSLFIDSPDVTFNHTAGALSLAAGVITLNQGT